MHCTFLRRPLRKKRVIQSKNILVIAMQSDPLHSVYSTHSVEIADAQCTIVRDSPRSSERSTDRHTETNRRTEKRTYRGLRSVASLPHPFPECVLGSYSVIKMKVKDNFNGCHLQQRNREEIQGFNVDQMRKDVGEIGRDRRGILCNLILEKNALCKQCELSWKIILIFIKNKFLTMYWYLT